jgi:hypothetical protein
MKIDAGVGFVFKSPSRVTDVRIRGPSAAPHPQPEILTV